MRLYLMRLSLLRNVNYHYNARNRDEPLLKEQPDFAAACMTNPLSTSRRVVCARCGGEFGCGLSKECWCAAETARHPLPSAGTGFDDCLCQACLRAIAEEHEQESRKQA